MLVDVSIDAELGVCSVRVTGRFELSQRRSAMHAILERLGADPDMPTLYDLRGSDFTHLSAEDMALLRDQNRQLAGRRGDTRLALLVADDLSYGLCRMYAALGVSSNLEVDVFRDEREALRWLVQAPSGRTGRPPVA
jgi:hypothetical protein